MMSRSVSRQVAGALLRLSCFLFGLAILTACENEASDYSSTNSNYQQMPSPSAALPSAAQGVDPITLSRNFDACRWGLSNCNQSFLTINQVTAVNAEAAQRNFDACRWGISSCNRSTLNAIQIEAVNAAAIARNYDACRWRLSNCNRTLLTSQQIASIGANGSYVPATEPLGTTARPGCSETGSCYGDLSTATGRPRTNYVRGYFRRDGTYVGSYYRS
jgi:hypothetical protein